MRNIREICFKNKYYSINKLDKNNIDILLFNIMRRDTMKNYIKGIIIGIVIGLILNSIPTMADTINALFNDVRININGIDQINWGNNIKLNDDTQTPASILYNDTVYLPMRKLAELNDKTIYWNGDSRTVSMTGTQQDIKILTEKPDKYGNIWKYYTFKVNECDDSSPYNIKYKDYYYLGVKDEKRGYERVYRLACKTVNITENEIYFLRQSKVWGTNESYPPADLIKLSFNNDENTQDGDIIDNFALMTNYGGDVYIHKNYVIISGHGPGTGALEFIYAKNYLTKESDTFLGTRWTTAKNIHIIEEGDTLIRIGYEADTGNSSSLADREITFDKTTNQFVK